MFKAEDTKVETNNLSKNYMKYLLLFVGLLLVSFLRIYNINYDQYWWDEIIAFYTADPSLSFFDTITRNFELEVTTPTYNLILKFFLNIFGYQTFIGRYISAIFGILTCLLVALTIYDLTQKNFKFLLFGLFLSGLNVSLISTSQELRNYSMLIFFVVLSIYLFNKILSEQTLYKKNFILFLFSASTIITVLIQPFAISILAAFSLYSLVFTVNEKKVLNPFVFSLISITIILMIYYFVIYINQINLDLIPDTLGDKVNLKFLTNFYFSKYFGSRLMGIVHLLILICLIIINRKLFLNFTNFIFYLFIIILITYLVPTIYEFLFRPILLVRYVLFTLPIIIILISALIYKLNSKRLKNFLISLLLISTLTNSFTESTFKQFYSIRPVFKPDFLSAFKTIEDSKHKDFIFSSHERDKEIFPYLEAALGNYSVKYIEEQNIGINYSTYSEIKQSNKQIFWIVCTYELNAQCKDTLLDNKSKLLEEISVNRLKLRLINLN